MKVQELEKRTGVDRTAIRFYEREGLLQPRRADNGYRDYSEEDARELERIRLMRELGLPLEQIRGLQDGSLPFRDVMEVQTAVLENREERMRRAGEVCRTLANFEGGYRDLDTARYQAMLSAPALPQGQGSRGGRVTYSEPVRQEFHPIRRFLARALDLGIVQGLVYVIILVLLRLKTANPLFSVIHNITAWALSIPFNAAFLHWLGTTPGKWALGIRVRTLDGKRYSFSEALRREFRVLLYGRGLYIPVVNIIAPVYMLYLGIRHGQEYLPWDEDGEVQYRKFPQWNPLHMALVPVLAAVPVVLILSAAPLEFLPVYSGNDMKLHDFANNFNAYVAFFDAPCMNINQQNGIYGGSGITVEMTLPDGTKGRFNKEGTFEYDYMGEELKVIRYNHTAYDRRELRPAEQEDWADTMDEECILAILSVAAAQEGMGYHEITQFLQELDTKLKQDASGGITWTVDNVMYYWKFDAEPMESPDPTPGLPTMAVHRVTSELTILIVSSGDPKG